MHQVYIKERSTLTKLLGADSRQIRAFISDTWDVLIRALRGKVILAALMSLNLHATSCREMSVDI